MKLTLSFFVAHPQCPVLVRPPRANLIISCTDDRMIGSVCSITCPPDHDLLGDVDEVTCMDSQVWSFSLIRSACGEIILLLTSLIFCKA